MFKNLMLKKQQIISFLIVFVLYLSNSSYAQLVDSLSHKEVIKVACIGNSITFGATIDDRSRDSYPAQLGTMLGIKWEVRNFGVSGRTLLSKGDYPYIKESAYQEALSWQPDIVLIKLGTNDSKPQNWKYKSDFEKDYLNLIRSFESLKSKPTIILSCAVPVFNNGGEINESIIKNEVNPLVKKIAEEKNLHVIDLYTPFVGKGKLFSDGIHPNSAGATEIAKIIYFNLTGKVAKPVLHPFGGVKTKWHGFDRYDFEFNGRSARVVCPSKPLGGKPWIWNARFPDWHYEMDSILLSEGFYVTYLNTDDLIGSPKAVAIWNEYYQYLTELHGLSEKVALEAVSRGGLYVYNWAKKNPHKVSCIYAEAPVCDFKSWPGGFGKGKGSPDDWNLVKEAYGFKSDEEA
ncbi:MAG: GDSL-type esterase/lipase family protein, partial [Bacteroidota bacterium]|nr:GDSL-type esterase/lipase family protein [Bacteroidota bacterium]